VFVILGSRNVPAQATDSQARARAQRHTLCLEGCPELERDTVASHGFVHGGWTAILSHSTESVMLEILEITEISNSAQIEQKVNVPW
jgi:hypothetical protein